MIKQNKLQFDMDSGFNSFLGFLKRGRGHMLPYLWNRFQWNYFHRLNLVSAFPINVDIEVSSMCNIKCDHCFRQYMNIPDSSLMPFSLYKKIVDECARFKLFTLKFSMRGEPLLHPEIAEMVQYGRDKGIKELWVNTNGSLLTEKIAEGFIKAKLDCLTVSFDGLGKMYESVRVPLKYEDTLSKLKMLMDVRKRFKADKPVVKVQTLWSAVKDNPDEYLEVMGNIVDKVSYNIDFDFKEIHFKSDPDYICYRLWQRLAITSQGNVLKCPSDFEEEEVLGNVKDTSIKELWDTQQNQERQKHLKRNRLQSKVCKKCHHGAKVEKNNNVYCGKEQKINTIDYQGDFEGVGLHRHK